MKKTMLWSALLALMCTQVHAELAQQPTQAQTPGSNTPPAAVSPNQEPVQKQNTPNSLPAAVQPQQTAPATNPPPLQNGQNAQPIQATQPQPAASVQTTPPAINCDYKIPAQTKTIDQTLLLSWSEKAATQIFDFDPVNVDNQVKNLKSCFTDQGWVGFNSALEKSGNLEAIKSQKLTVSSQVDGQTQVTESKDNQWKITLPLHVVYQNDKEKVTQLLHINLTVGRKTSGDLGIIQMIAIPRTSTAATAPSSTDEAAPHATGTTTNNTNADSNSSSNSSTTH